MHGQKRHSKARGPRFSATTPGSLPTIRRFMAYGRKPFQATKRNNLRGVRPGQRLWCALVLQTSPTGNRFRHVWYSADRHRPRVTAAVVKENSCLLSHLDRWRPLGTILNQIAGAGASLLRLGPWRLRGQLDRFETRKVRGIVLRQLFDFTNVSVVTDR